MSKWIDWPGGACPVPPDSLVEIKTRDGFVQSGRAGDYMWNHEQNNVNYGDIVAYRVVRGS